MNEQAATSATAYQDSVDPATNTVTRTMVDGKKIVWTPKAHGRNKPVYTTNNGVTIEKLRQAGAKVRVMHYRIAEYTRTSKGGFNDHRIIVIPAGFKKSVNDYRLLSRGGYTHVHITSKDGRHFTVSSDCSVFDQFCYKEGLKQALNRLNKNDLTALQLL